MQLTNSVEKSKINFQQYIFDTAYDITNIFSIYIMMRFSFYTEYSKGIVVYFLKANLQKHLLFIENKVALFVKLTTMFSFGIRVPAPLAFLFSSFYSFLLYCNQIDETSIFQFFRNECNPALMRKCEANTS